MTLRRREFITLLGGAAAAWPVVARAQQPAMPVIGVLSGGPPGSYENPPFLNGLRQVGYVEGRNVSIEYQWADGQYDRLPALVAELIRRKVSVIHSIGLPASVAAKMATTAIPIVFQIGANPVELGLVINLTRPGANVTGVTSLAGQLNVKRLQLIVDTVPAAKVVAAIVNPSDPNSGNLARNLQEAARTLGIELHVLPVRTEGDFDSAFKTMRERGVGALVISPDTVLGSRPVERAASLLRDRVPTISASRDFALAGGLMSYLSDDMDTLRAAGIYAGRILKGDKPGDLPVQQATRFTLTINLKTVESLGITFPTSLLLRADEVIE
jgi:putative tryptophan/tyrosine transport system substrate-binding protein